MKFHIVFVFRQIVKLKSLPRIVRFASNTGKVLLKLKGTTNWEKLHLHPEPQ